MIKSDIVKIPKIENFVNDYIENELSKKVTAVIRWAGVDGEENELVVSVSYEM